VGLCVVAANTEANAVAEINRVAELRAARAECAGGEMEIAWFVGGVASREELNDAAERRVAPRRGCGTVDDLDAVDAAEAEAGPVGESGFTIADRSTIDEQLYVLDFAAAEESARCDHRRAARRAVEHHRDSRYLRERFGQRFRRSFRELLAPHDGDRGRSFGDRLRFALDGDDGFDARRR